MELELLFAASVSLLLQQVGAIRSGYCRLSGPSGWVVYTGWGPVGEENW